MKREYGAKIGSIKEMFMEATQQYCRNYNMAMSKISELFKNECKHFLYLTSKGGAIYNENIIKVRRYQLGHLMNLYLRLFIVPS